MCLMYVQSKISYEKFRNCSIFKYYDGYYVDGKFDFVVYVTSAYELV